MESALSSNALEFERDACVQARWPSFSIVIPTYERRDLVCETVSSLKSLAYPGEWEAIVVVDGSSDGTAAALQEMEPGFELTILQQRNYGAGHARNAGAALAGNEILLFLDDDMFVQPDLLLQHARMYREGADAVIGDTPLDHSSPRGFLTDGIGRWINSESVGSPLSPFDIFSGQLSVRRHIFEEVGRFDDALTSHPAFSNEDADLGVRLLARCKVRHNPSAVTWQRYIVTPRQYMARAESAAVGDLRFLAKHPQFARELFEARGRDTPLARYVYFPLARVPFAAEMLARTAVAAAEAGLRTRLRSSSILRRFFSGARSLAYWSALRKHAGLPGRQKVLVLCYHAIADQADDPVLAAYGVPPTQFGKHLDALRRRGFTFVTPKQFLAFVQHGAPLPRKPLLLTVDDCYDDLIAAARDQLQPRGIPALAFAVTAKRTNEWDQPAGARISKLLSGEQLRLLETLGVDVGSHSRTHRELPLIADREVEDEVAGSREDLQRLFGHAPRFFAYPYGSRGPRCIAAVRSAGYDAAFSTNERYATCASAPHDIPRVIITAADLSWRFWLKTSAPRVAAALDRNYGRAASLFSKIRKLLRG